MLNKLGLILAVLKLKSDWSATMSDQVAQERVKFWHAHELGKLELLHTEVWYK